MIKQRIIFQRSEYMKHYFSKNKNMRRYKRNRKKWINQEGIKERIAETQRAKNKIKKILYDAYLSDDPYFTSFVNKSLKNFKGK